MDFFSYKNKLKPAAGRILISEPFLPDPNFERSIVLLCEHNEEGSLGFVLNRPTEWNVVDKIDDVKNFDGKLYVGGPVEQTSLNFIHRYPALEESTPLGNGIYFGGNFEKLFFLLETKQIDTADVRFFMGYSGWAAGQLGEELDVDSWIVSDKVDEDLIFDTDPALLWKKTLQKMGGRFTVYSNYPADPRMN